MNDELREQLGKLDPMHPGVPVESPTTTSARNRLEQIMNTPLIEQGPSDSRSELGRQPSTRKRTARDNPRRMWLIVGSAVASAVVALGVGAALITGNSDEGSEIAAGPPLELSLGDSNITASCMQFDVAVLADMSPALAGTATSVDGDTVTLTVDHWYTGGDAATVILHAPTGMQALIDGFDFETGKQYLITAAQGNVNFCGYSGLATPELTAAFQQAFGS